MSKVLAKSCADINSNTKTDLIRDLKDKIENFKYILSIFYLTYIMCFILMLRIHAPNISSVYLCLAKLMDAVGEEGKGIILYIIYLSAMF